MAERKATNKYYPADFDPDKHGSINRYRKYYHLREQKERPIKKLEELSEPERNRTITVRFELPFNVWCLHCNKHIGMGVRFNADKKRIGEYFSTPIWEFRMKCHLCSGVLIIHTDPKNTEYVCFEGLRRKVEDFEETTQIRLMDEAEKMKMLEDPFYKLEHDLVDKQKYEDETPELERLKSVNEKIYADTYAVSQRLRKKFREEKKANLALKEEQEQLQEKYSLSILPEIEAKEDVDTAKSVNYEKNKQWYEYEEKKIKAAKQVFSSNDSLTSSAILEKVTKKQKVQNELFGSNSIKSYLKGIRVIKK